MQLLFLFKIGIVLGDTLQCKLIGQPNVGRLWHVLFLEVLDFNWVRCAEKAYLWLRHQTDNTLNNFREVDWQEFVYLVKYKHFTGVKVGYISAGKIKKAAWSRDQDMHCLVETVKVFS